MQPIPVEFFSEQGGTFYIPTLPSTASLLAYYDAGITSSYTSGSSTWYDLTGNGYHATLTGSMPTYSTDIAGNHYNYNPSLTFNIGQGYFSAPDSLCTNFGTTATPFPYSICSTPPTYLLSGDWTAILIGKQNTIDPTFSLMVGSKVDFLGSATPGVGDLRGLARYAKGLGTSARSVLLDNIDGVWGTMALTKICYINAKSTFLSWYKSPYVTPDTVFDNGADYADANQILKGTGNTLIGSGSCTITAVMLYNRILSPAEVKQTSDYFTYRKLN